MVFGVWRVVVCCVVVWLFGVLRFGVFRFWVFCSLALGCFSCFVFIVFVVRFWYVTFCCSFGIFCLLFLAVFSCLVFVFFCLVIKCFVCSVYCFWVGFVVLAFCSLLLCLHRWEATYMSSNGFSVFFIRY